MKVRGTQITQPDPIEVNVDTVYVRTNVIPINETDFKGWEYDETQYTKDEYIAKIHALESSQKTPDELYKEIDLSTETLSVVQKAKIGQLQYDMNISLAQGFASSADGTSRTYAIDPLAMGKWTGILSLINAGSTDPVEVKDTSGNKVNLDTTQFKQMAHDGFAFFIQQEQKLWAAEDKVKAATTNQDIDVVTL